MGIVLQQWPTLAVFAVTIAAIVVNRFDATVAALLGVVVMVWMGTMTEVEAAHLVDWNVMATLSASGSLPGISEGPACPAGCLCNR